MAQTDRAFAVVCTRDGGFAMVGSTTSYGAGNVDAYLIKTDADGQVEWTKTYGTEAFDMGHDVQQRDDGGYMVFGYTESYGAKARDLWFVRLDHEGNEVASSIVGGAEADHGTRGVVTADGGSVMLGYTKSYSAGHWDVYLVKVDTACDTVWTRTFGGSWPETGYGIAKTSDGGFILTGQTWSNRKRDCDLLIIKTNIDGFLLK